MRYGRRIERVAQYQRIDRVRGKWQFAGAPNGLSAGGRYRCCAPQSEHALCLDHLAEIHAGIGTRDQHLVPKDLLKNLTQDAIKLIAETFAHRCFCIPTIEYGMIRQFFVVRAGISHHLTVASGQPVFH